MQKKSKRRIGGILCGSGVGLANSLFGGGGGMIAVPMLQRLGLEEKRAHATAILLILPVSLLSFFLYLYKGIYSSAVLIPTAVGVTLGGLLGAKFLNALPVKSVRTIFSILQFAAGVSLLFFR